MGLLVLMQEMKGFPTQSHSEVHSSVNLPRHLVLGIDGVQTASLGLIVFLAVSSGHFPLNLIFMEVGEVDILIPI
jgi:hypothetical protein